MNAPANLPALRLEYPADAVREFDLTPSSWKVLVETIYPSAKSSESVVMALSYCKARGLDPFKKPVHIVPMWSAAAKDYVETIWPGIAELRTTAFRTGNYAGCDESEFGPEIAREFSGSTKVDGKWQDKTVKVTFPEWCRMTVYRDLHGKTCRFVGPKVFWLEAYATTSSRSELPNDMWADRPRGQIEKCAEAAALRKAFPEELGNELTAEEMYGRRIDGSAEAPKLIEPQAAPKLAAPPITQAATPPKLTPPKLTAPKSAPGEQEPPPAEPPERDEDELFLTAKATIEDEGLDGFKEFWDGLSAAEKRTLQPRKQSLKDYANTLELGGPAFKVED